MPAMPAMLVLLAALAALVLALGARRSRVEAYQVASASATVDGESVTVGGGEESLSTAVPFIPHVIGSELARADGSVPEVGEVVFPIVASRSLVRSL